MTEQDLGFQFTLPIIEFLTVPDADTQGQMPGIVQVVNP
jgi:hypothetical protein